MDYRLVLKQECEKRKKRLGTYSQRTFAKDIGLSASFVTLLLSGKRRLSEEAGQNIAERLQWSRNEKQLFLCLIQYEYAEDQKNRQKLLTQIQELQLRLKPFRSVAKKEIPYLTDWYYTALLELTFVEGFVPEVSWIEKRLGITNQQAANALSALVKYKLLIRNGKKMKKVQDNLCVPDHSSPFLRETQSQMIQKASAALKEHKRSSRTFRSMTMAIDPKKIPEANKRISEFARDLMSFLESGERKAVYCFSTQLFRLDRGRVNESIVS